jgi:hypothetical protein
MQVCSHHWGFCCFQHVTGVDFSAVVFLTTAYFIKDLITSFNCTICLTIQHVFIISVFISDLALGWTQGNFSKGCTEQYICKQELCLTETLWQIVCKMKLLTV